MDVIWGVWAAPGGFRSIQKGGGLRPPPFWMVLKPPGAAQTPKTDPKNPARLPSGTQAFVGPDEPRGGHFDRVGQGGCSGAGCFRLADPPPKPNKLIGFGDIHGPKPYESACLRSPMQSKGLLSLF